MSEKCLREISVSDHMIGIEFHHSSGAKCHEHTFPGGYRVR